MGWVLICSITHYPTHFDPSKFKLNWIFTSLLSWPIITFSNFIQIRSIVTPMFMCDHKINQFYIIKTLTILIFGKLPLLKHVCHVSENHFIRTTVCVSLCSLNLPNQNLWYILVGFFPSIIKKRLKMGRTSHNFMPLKWRKAIGE